MHLIKPKANVRVFFIISSISVRMVQNQEETINFDRILWRVLTYRTPSLVLWKPTVELEETEFWSRDGHIFPQQVESAFLIEEEK